MQSAQNVHTGSLDVRFADEYIEAGNLLYRRMIDLTDYALNFCQEIGNAQFIETTDLLSKNQTLGDGDTVHFCNKAIYELGFKYFAAFSKML